MTTGGLPRGPGDIQTAVVNLVDRLAPIVPLAHQPRMAREIATVIAVQPNTMTANMLIRQSIIRAGLATHDQVIEGLAAWVTIIFDLGNLRRDVRRGLDVGAAIPEESLDLLSRCLARAPKGCIVALPHIGSMDLFCAQLKQLGFNTGFVFTISDDPTPTERWLYEARSATGCTPIVFGRRNTGTEISRILRNNGVVFMVVDVYPTAKYKGIRVRMHDAAFNFPPGPARYARSGTLVLPGFASRRDATGFSVRLLDPIEHPDGNADATFTQALADRIGQFTAQRPEAYWLWHPIPNDPFMMIAQRHRPDILRALVGISPDDEAAALAVEAIDPDRLARLAEWPGLTG